MQGPKAATFCSTEYKARKQVHARSKSLTKLTDWLPHLAVPSTIMKAMLNAPVPPKWPTLSIVTTCWTALKEQGVKGMNNNDTAPSRVHSKRWNLQCTCTWHHLCLRWNPVDLIFPWVVHSPFASYLHVLWWRTTTCTNRGRKKNHWC